MPPEGRRPTGLGPDALAPTAGSRALGESESRQVRKEAALRVTSQVPRILPARANRPGSSRGARLDGGCATGLSSALLDAMAALYRKYRQQDFDEVIGQEGIVRTLKNAVATGQVRQAYLFAGPRGTGKTSMARILAKALNCVQGPTPTPDNTCHTCVA